MKIMIYIGEKEEFFGYKKAQFNINNGTKVIVNNKFAICMTVAELSEKAFYLFKVLFGELKHKRISNRMKVNKMLDYIKELSDERFVEGHYQRIQDAIERNSMILDSVVEKM